MTKFRNIEDYARYKGLALWPADTAYHIDVGVDYNTRADQPHVVLTVYPRVKDWKAKRPSGLDEHYHIPLNRRQAVMLRDWLNRYLSE